MYIITSTVAWRRTAFDCVDVGNVAIRTRIKGAVYEMTALALTVNEALARSLSTEKAILQ